MQNTSLNLKLDKTRVAIELDTAASLLENDPQQFVERSAATSHIMKEAALLLRARGMGPCLPKASIRQYDVVWFCDLQRHHLYPAIVMEADTTDTAAAFLYKKDGNLVTSVVQWSNYEFTWKCWGIKTPVALFHSENLKGV